MWKTSTIVVIFILASLVVGYTIYDKNIKITKIEQNIDERVREEIFVVKENIKKLNEQTINELRRQNDSLKNDIEALEKNLELYLSGGSEVKRRTDIINSSKKNSRNLKLRKGKVFKDSRTNLLAFIRPDYYEDKVLVNLTFKNKDTFDEEWYPGKYY